MYVYVWLCIYMNHFAIQHKLIQHCKSTMLKLKKKKEQKGQVVGHSPNKYRRDIWTLWEKARVGCSERTALKQVYYQW